MQSNRKSIYWGIGKGTLLVIALIIMTITTQVGGIILILSLVTTKTLKRKFYNQRYLGITVFILLYLLSTFVIIPRLAPVFGRKPLPVSKNGALIPASFMSFLFNRHYVNTELYQTAFQISEQLNSQHSDYKVIYLDANFPFVDGFPLLPHLSHNDGQKIDLALYYTNISSDDPLLNATPTLTGYGYFISPQTGEINYPQRCIQKGNWYYDITGKFTFNQKEKYQLNEEVTKDLLTIISANSSIKKIFIEPHLKSRLGFNNENKIRFHGCHAVRHDDHIHIQL